MNQKRAQAIQIISEALIPILGYFFWNWNFYFIALFYLLDLLANTGFLYLKLNKFRTAATPAQITLHSAFYLLSLAGIALLGILISGQLIPGFDLEEQSINFIMLEDLGLPQGFLLVPLVVYTAYLQYKMEFVLTKKHEHGSAPVLLKKHSLGMLVSLAFLGTGFGLCLLVKIPELAAVLTLIALTTAYSFFIKKKA
ncbi:MAG: hypothetical protein K0R65_2467 [Crocinitomicaceae bacterium]|jgi:hypothetical protein|nr:hypothetical protein [Crocinitomicaceae bacterium]